MVSLQMSSAAILNLGSAIISLGAQIGQRLMESDIMIRYDEKNESTEIEDENILLFQKMFVFTPERRNYERIEPVGVEGNEISDC